MKRSLPVRLVLALCVLVGAVGSAHTVRVRIASTSHLPVGGAVIRCEDVKQDIILGVGTNRWTTTSDSAGEVVVWGKWNVHLDVRRQGYSPVFALYSPRNRAISVLSGLQQGQVLLRTNGYITLFMEEAK
jgi:hypothetical protein